MNVLEAKNISKVFPGVLALDSVNISLKKGEIHCIIGENGAGKSTLIKCLTGVYKPEGGELFIEGEDAFNNKELFEKVVYVPQEIDLFTHMTVAENLFMPFEKSGFKGIVNKKKMEEAAKPLLKKFAIDVSPDEIVKNISVSAQQLIQSIRGIVHKNYEIIMFDEPTTSLSSEDSKILFEIIKQLKDGGKSVVFISHKLEEIFEIGDYISVFRNGKNISSIDIKEIDIPWVISKMSGKDIDQSKLYYSENLSDEVLLEVKNLSGERFTDISFNLHKGEILGFSGLVGAGRSELMQAIFGYLPIYSGEIKLDGKAWKKGDTNFSVKNGIIYLPEERKKQGILPMLPIKDNIVISVLENIVKGIFISSSLEEKLAKEIVEKYDVKTPSIDKAIKFLSGGNQQKVIIGRAMNSNPKVLIFDEPTKGIDVGTKAEIYRLMKKLAEEKGIGIILISSEMDEVKKCSNRILALYNGQKYGEFSSNAKKEDIMNSIIGGSSSKCVD